MKIHGHAFVSILIFSQLQSTVIHTYEWFVYRLSSWFRSVGHRVKTHKVTSAVDNERGDIEIGKYIVLPCGQDNLLPLSGHGTLIDRCVY